MAPQNKKSWRFFNKNLTLDPFDLLCFAVWLAGSCLDSAWSCLSLPSLWKMMRWIPTQQLSSPSAWMSHQWILLFLCDLQDAVVVLQKGTFRFYSIYINPLHFACAKIPSCHKSQFNQIHKFFTYIWPVMPKKQKKQGISCMSDPSNYISRFRGPVQYS